jgi:hypothetical protein
MRDIRSNSEPSVAVTTAFRVLVPVEEEDTSKI